jgi:hypothetical protein
MKKKDLSKKWKEPKVKENLEELPSVGLETVIPAVLVGDLLRENYSPEQFAELVKREFINKSKDPYKSALALLNMLESWMEHLDNEIEEEIGTVTPVPPAPPVQKAGVVHDWIKIAQESVNKKPKWATKEIGRKRERGLSEQGF